LPEVLRPNIYAFFGKELPADSDHGAKPNEVRRK